MSDDRRHREILAREIVDRAADAVVFADAEGVVRLWNAAAERLFGYSAAEAIGKTLDPIIPEKLRERHWTGYREVMKTGHTRYGTELLSVPAMRKDGVRISLEFSVALIPGESGKPGGIVAILRDVTERRRREQEARQQR